MRKIDLRSPKIKTYKIDPNTYNDGRQEIFQVWQQRDAEMMQKVDAEFYIREAEGKLPTEPAMLV